MCDIVSEGVLKEDWILEVYAHLFLGFQRSCECVVGVRGNVHRKPFLPGPEQLL